LRNKQQSNEIIKGLKVDVRNDDFNQALRKFKKKVAEDGVLQDYRERQEYTKPSVKRAKAKAAGRARWLRKQAKMDGGIPSTQQKRKK
jgi:small subunit ribosomal protein S21